MLLVYVDEAGDAKFRDYLGFSIATLNARFYPRLKTEAQAILRGVGWDPASEFKGSHLFAAGKGVPGVEIDRRVDAARKLLALNVATANSRMRFHYGKITTHDSGGDYLRYLPSLLEKSLPRAPKGAGKNLISVACDERSDVKPDELHTAVKSVTDSRGYVLHERATFCKSCFDTCGLMFADLVGYLAARVDTISNDAELLEGLSPEQLENNGKVRKLKTSRSLIDQIKQLSLHRLDGSRI